MKEIQAFSSGGGCGGDGQGGRGGEGASRRCSCLCTSQVQKPVNPQQPGSSQTMCQAARGGGAAAGLPRPLIQRLMFAAPIPTQNVHIKRRHAHTRDITPAGPPKQTLAVARLRWSSPSLPALPDGTNFFASSCRFFTASGKKKKKRELVQASLVTLASVI